MGKILIVDDRQLFPTIPERYHALVECKAYMEGLTAESFASYEAVFIHERNTDEWDAAMEAFDEGLLTVCASFTGEEDTPSIYKGVHSLPRSLMQSQFASFLYCTQGGEWDASRCMEVFHDPEFADRFTAEPQEDLRGGKQEYEPPPIYLAGGNASTRAVSVAHEELSVQADADGRIDYPRLFDKLSALEEERPLVVDETYIQDGDGLELLLRLRLKAQSSYSRWPVYLRLETPLTTWIRREPAYMVAAMSGSRITAADHVVSADEQAPPPLSRAEHLKLLEGLPLTPKDLTDRHDRANEWGPVQFYNGVRALQGTSRPEPGWVTKTRSRLRERRYYSYLFGLQELRASVEMDGSETASEASLNDSVPQSAANAFVAWDAFLRSAKKRVRILLLDDEAEKGWQQAFTSLFEAHPASGTVEAPFQAAEFQGSLDQIAERVADEAYDVVLCDMRLRPNVERNVTQDVDELSGIKLLQAIKKARPDRPVIAFTASNKSWMFEEALSSGADGYWVKEAPDYDVRFTHTVEQVASLLDTIRNTVQRRRELQFLWDLNAELTDRLKDKEFVASWDFPAYDSDRSAGTRLEAIVCSLKTIARRLKQAYWLLLDRRSNFEASVFDTRQEDMAFLSVWSCLDEIHELYFRSPDKEAFEKQIQGAVAFYFLDPRDSKWKIYWKIEDGKTASIHDEMTVRLRKKLCREENGVPRYPKLYADKIRMEWLLRLLGKTKLVDVLNKKRGLRNRLGLQHGKGASPPHAKVEDIRELCLVWSTLLLAR
jgi:CheY-like chemotaxis protein